jgi:GTP-binding protein HflX
MSQPIQTFVGKGKAEEIREYIKENEIGTVIFVDELLAFPTLKNWNVSEVKIHDRTNLILDILAGSVPDVLCKTQVEHAQ